MPLERQLTFAPHGHILTNTAVWSPDSRWIVYDVRPDPAGSQFLGNRIERVEVATGRVETLYASTEGAHCGVATYSPVDDRVAFIHGPERPTPDWQYAACRRRGVWLHADSADRTPTTLDACQLTGPFIPGALRGGSHVHVFSGDGAWVSFTYQDHLLAAAAGAEGGDLDQRNIGVSVPLGPVAVRRDHPRNHDGALFSVLVTRTQNHPRPGSDDIAWACSDAWVGTHGYRRADGGWQSRAIAFQGTTVTDAGTPLVELFLVDLPNDVTRPGDGPLAGTESSRPAPPQGFVQRRLTFTADRRYPGLQGLGIGCAAGRTAAKSVSLCGTMTEWCSSGPFPRTADSRCKEVPDRTMWRRHLAGVPAAAMWRM